MNTTHRLLQSWLHLTALATLTGTLVLASVMFTIAGAVILFNVDLPLATQRTWTTLVTLGIIIGITFSALATYAWARYFRRNRRTHRRKVLQ